MHTPNSITENQDLINKKNHIQELSSDVKNNVSNSISNFSCPIQDTFIDLWNGYFKVKETTNSSVMNWHLRHIPLVPWVIQKWILLNLLWMTREVFMWEFPTRTQFFDPMLPGDEIRMDSNDKSIINKEGKKNIFIEPFLWNLNFEVWEYNEKSEIKHNPEYLDNYLLQNWSFRFVDWANFISKKEDENINVWDTFQWFYNIPYNFKFTQYFRNEKIVPSYLLEEMAAQMWVLVLWEIMWKAIDEQWQINEQGKILTFNTSISHFHWVIKPQDKFQIVWKVRELWKRQASFEYIGYNQNNEKIISWIISWNIVPLKILKRISKN